jgi:hypothetical protein
MSKERAIALLGTAKMMESPEDIRALINKALLFLDTDLDLVPAIELAKDMIWEALQQIQKNAPLHTDTPQERAEKIPICESALLQIAEYAKLALKARVQGSIEVAENLQKSKENHTLHDFADTEVEISVEGGSTVKTTMGRFNEVCEAVKQDPSLIDRVVLGGDQ